MTPILTFKRRPRIGRCIQCLGHFEARSDQDVHCPQCLGWDRFIAHQAAAQRAFDVLRGSAR